jgi:hypothetical protein
MLQLAVAGKRLRCSLSAVSCTRRTMKPRTHAFNEARGSNLRQVWRRSDVAIVLSVCCVMADHDSSSPNQGVLMSPVFTSSIALAMP